jgi:uncharacterized protein YjbI with pentapeptide repeats
MIDTTFIGTKIADARKKLNLSQAQLAEQLFISSQAVGKWERGESMPDITTFNRLAEILHVDLNYFSEKFSSVAQDKSLTEHFQKDSGNQDEPVKKKNLDWDMSQGNWVDADFSGLKELKEKFSSSNMKNCRFVGSDLSGLTLQNNNIDRCNFSGSEINGSRIDHSNLDNNSFFACSLKETQFTKNNIGQCDFSEADLTNAKFSACNFQKNLLPRAIWQGTVFYETHLDETVFEGKLEDCSFENCAFYKVTFQNSTLINTFFKNNKNLKRIKFIDCKADRMTFEFLKSGKANLEGITVI